MMVRRLDRMLFGPLHHHHQDVVFKLFIGQLNIFSFPSYPCQALYKLYFFISYRSLGFNKNLLNLEHTASIAHRRITNVILSPLIVGCVPFSSALLLVEGLPSSSNNYHKLGKTIHFYSYISKFPNHTHVFTNIL